MKNVVAGLFGLSIVLIGGCGADTASPKESLADQLNESAPSEDVSQGIDAALEKYGDKQRQD